MTRIPPPVTIPDRLIDDVEEHIIRDERRWTGVVRDGGGVSRPLLVLEIAGELVAVRNRCPHRDISLLRGRLDADRCILECPSHGWELPVGGADLRGAPVVERDGRLYLTARVWTGPGTGGTGGVRG